MSVKRRVEGGAVSRATVARLADEILDQLPLTDRVYHHLDYSRPLVVELAARVGAAHPPPARVLVIGSDSLLAQTLIELGYEMELWAFPEGHLIDELLDRVRQTVTPRQLAQEPLPWSGQPYDAVILPLVLESVPGDPIPLLRKLRGILRPNGSLILATTNVGRLDLRLRSFLGMSTTAAYPSFHVSLSFPPLPRLRYFHRDDLHALVRRAGWQVRASDYVIAHAACSTIDPFPPGQYAMLQAGHGLQRLIPATRHAIVLDLSPRVGDRGPTDGVEESEPRVSAVLAVTHGGELLRQALTALVEQDYPTERYEIIVLHDGQSPENLAVIREVSESSAVPVREIVRPIPEGPAARNAAMEAATGDLCAHTDDGCRLPLGWIRTAALAFGESTGVLTGPVIGLNDSYPDFLVLPGSRLGWDPHEIYPIFNVIYRREPALASGGFDVGANGRNPPPLGWDTELAWRLQRMGWEGRFMKELFLYRGYGPPGRLVWMKSEWQLAGDLPRAVARIPELRQRHLKARWFAGTRTLGFDLFLAGLALAAFRRQRGFLLLALPWIGCYAKFMDLWPIGRWPSSARLFAAIGTRHVIWLGGLIRGSIKARRLVL